MTKREALEKRMRGLDIAVYTYGPGDGVTRYRFGPLGSSYFANDGIATVLGIKDALTWIDGYVKGQDRHKLWDACGLS